MKKILYVVGGIICLALSVSLLLHPLWANSQNEVRAGVINEGIVIIELPSLESQITDYLITKKSPLGNYVPLLLQQPNWKRIVAISAIESSYCKRQLGFNCWGIKGGKNDPRPKSKEGYLIYKSFSDGIFDAERVLSTRYKGQTYAQMNCVYVQPCSPNWLNLTTRIDRELTVIQKSSR